MAVELDNLKNLRVESYYFVEWAKALIMWDAGVFYDDYDYYDYYHFDAWNNVVLPLNYSKEYNQTHWVFNLSYSLNVVQHFIQNWTLWRTDNGQMGLNWMFGNITLPRVCLASLWLINFTMKSASLLSSPNFTLLTIQQYDNLTEEKPESIADVKGHVTLQNCNVSEALLWHCYWSENDSYKPLLTMSRWCDLGWIQSSSWNGLMFFSFSESESNRWQHSVKSGFKTQFLGLREERGWITGFK